MCIYSSDSSLFKLTYIEGNIWLNEEACIRWRSSLFWGKVEAKFQFWMTFVLRYMSFPDFYFIFLKCSFNFVFGHSLDSAQIFCILTKSLLYKVSCDRPFMERGRFIGCIQGFDFVIFEYKSLMTFVPLLYSLLTSIVV